MARTPLPIADGFYTSLSTPLVDKRIVNMYPVIPESDAATPKALFNTPGIIEFADVGVETGTGATRGSLTFTDGVPYYVIGNSLYEFDELGVETNRGTITGSDDVSMTTNGINIVIQDPDGDSYFYTPSTTTLAINSDAVFLSFGQSRSVVFLDGFYLYNTDSEFFWSSPKTTNDGKNFDALDFADAELSPDKLIKLHVNHNQLYVFGQTTTEIYSTSAVGATFQRINGAALQKGCSARESVINFDNGFFFLGGDVGEKPAIWKGIGSSFVKLSTSSIDQLIHKYDALTISRAKSFSYAENGNYFAVFTVGADTFVYDTTTSSLAGGIPQWHQRQTGIGNGDNFFVWRAIHAQLAYGKILVGDDRSGKIGYLDVNTYTEYGEPIERIIATKPFMNNLDYIYSDEIELFMQTGLGSAELPDPQIRMDYSDDGGRIFSNEIFASMGKVGEYNIKVSWDRLGAFPRTRSLRFKTTAPVPINIYGLFASAELVTNG
jgi:hypothetical protein